MDHQGTRFLAHSENQGGIFESLQDHISHVAQTAGRFAGTFGAADQAVAAGLLHDLGKYGDRFGRRVRGESRGRAGDHCTAGAYVALRRYRAKGCIPAAAILGHHGGLQSIQTDSRRWATDLEGRIQDGADRLTDPDIQRLLDRFRGDGFELPDISNSLAASEDHPSDSMLATRMLFSTLVDADFIETEAHFDGDAQQPRRYRPPGPALDAAQALEAVEQHIGKLQAQADPEDPIAAIRAALHRRCLEAAEMPPGLFTLSAPTGSGKTLSMLAFALKHAARHGLRRIVLVMPFLNIIDQTAQQYRELFTPAAGFPEHTVLEDHSLAGIGESRDDDGPNGSEHHRDREDRTRRLLAENWDAPIILTTSLRCLESLASNKPSACRKLHRLAGSVILFDEVQTLPKQLATATLASLSHLSSRFGATVLFATATQPAFEHLDPSAREISQNGWKPTPILDEQTQASLFSTTARRTEVHWDHSQGVTLEAMADRLADEKSDQWMCIVNLKRHASGLFRLLAERSGEGLFHLSTAMCPAHRQTVLAEIRDRLATRQPARLVSTQCVEAGVDVDFAVVYRALAPLEAISQAAGRCNRHGKRPDPGRVHVFKPVEDDGRCVYPPGGYDIAAAATEVFVNTQLDEGKSLRDLIHDPRLIERYYRQLYTLTGTGEDTHKTERKLLTAIKERNFAEYARNYRLIDARTINILTPYDPAEFDRLGEQIDQILTADTRTPGQLRNWIADARTLSVGHFHKTGRADPILEHLQPIHFSQDNRQSDTADWYLLTDPKRYSNQVGLVPPDEFSNII
jgi:CRISPR-associated helicase Cas3/CRISPR-associated endonuclease Cas3-HD